MYFVLFVIYMYAVQKRERIKKIYKLKTKISVETCNVLTETV